MGDLTTTTEQSTRLASRYRDVRHLTEALAAPLSPEDQTVQSMPDVSPTKWHRAHTSWFFETFLLESELRGYRPFHPAYAYLFNSYYEGVGARYPRPRRGVVSRPGIAEVAEYRRHVDESMARLLAGSLTPDVSDLVELGLHHEQQHQELLLMDIKHVLSCNPLQPAYTTVKVEAPRSSPPTAWIDHDGGPVRGRQRWRRLRLRQRVPPSHHPPGALRPGRPPRHLRGMAGLHGRRRVLPSRPVALRRVGHGAGRGLGCPAVLVQGRRRLVAVHAGGPQLVDLAEPVCHVSYYEADAFARWAGARLPTEAEWEAVASERVPEGNFLDLSILHPRPTTQGASLFGDVWQWTSSSYSPYPGFRPRPGRWASTTASSW